MEIKFSSLETKTVTGNCAEHGEFEAEVFVRDGTPADAQCPHCVVELAKKQSAIEAGNRDNAIMCQRIDRIGLPHRHLSKGYGDYIPENPNATAHLETCKQFATNWPETFDAGKSLILCGKPGTGKTHLASVVARQVATQNDAQPIYTTASAMLRYIRGAYSSQAAYSESEAVNRFGLCDLLVLDELGVKLASDYDKSMLFEVIDIRYQQTLPTIVISNLTIQELCNQTDMRMIDRIRETGELCIFDWDSYRDRAGRAISHEKTN